MQGTEPTECLAELDKDHDMMRDLYVEMCISGEQFVLEDVRGEEEVEVIKVV